MEVEIQARNLSRKFQVPCKIMALFDQYFVMAAFTWMVCIGISFIGLIRSAPTVSACASSLPKVIELQSKTPIFSMANIGTYRFQNFLKSTVPNWILLVIGYGVPLVVCAATGLTMWDYYHISNPAFYRRPDL